MIAFLLFLILLFFVGKSILGAFFSVAGAVVGLLLVLIVYIIKKRRR